MSSRLFTSLREENGLSYTVSVDFSHYKDAGAMFIHTGFDKDSLVLKNISELNNDTTLEEEERYEKLYKSIKNSEDKKFGPGGLPIIINELEQLKNTHVSDDELLKAKGYINGTLILELENSYSLTEYFGRQIVEEYDFILNFEDLLQKYQTITSEQIKTVSNKYFDYNKLNISTIGSYEEDYIKKFIEMYVFKKDNDTH
jgi:predicted Zn-dependent peptidase